MKRLVLLGLAIGACIAAGAAPGASVAATGSQRLTVYSVALQEQFVNNADDRTRGVGNNPFGNFKDSAPVTKTGSGPFPGDQALFSFTLYTNVERTTRAGSAIFRCYYNFNKNAFCDVSFQLSGRGTLTAVGAFNFNATKFTLAVTGGYGGLESATGVVSETPSAKHAQRLSFVLD